MPDCRGWGWLSYSDNVFCYLDGGIDIERKEKEQVDCRENPQKKRDVPGRSLLYSSEGSA